MLPKAYEAFAEDEAELTGSFCLYLAQERADFLKGSLTSVNWDVEEVEARQGEVVSGKLLRTSWVPILPCSGGPGF